MKRLVTLLTLIPLTLLSACDGDNAQDRMYAVQQCNTSSLEKPVNEFTEHMLGCMKSKGYVFDANAANCALAEIKEESSNCYRKTD